MYSSSRSSPSAIGGRARWSLLCYLLAPLLPETADPFQKSPPESRGGRLVGKLGSAAGERTVLGWAKRCPTGCFLRQGCCWPTCFSPGALSECFQAVPRRACPLLNSVISWPLPRDCAWGRMELHALEGGLWLARLPLRLRCLLSLSLRELGWSWPRQRSAPRGRGGGEGRGFRERRHRRFLRRWWPPWEPTGTRLGVPFLEIADLLLELFSVNRCVFALPEGKAVLELFPEPKGGVCNNHSLVISLVDADVRAFAVGGLGVIRN